MIAQSHTEVLLLGETLGTDFLICVFLTLLFLVFHFFAKKIPHTAFHAIGKLGGFILILIATNMVLVGLVDFFK